MLSSVQQSSAALTVGDAMQIIIALGGDIWLLWGFESTVNIALIGWLLEKAGSLSRNQKGIASVGYSIFCVVLVVSFMNGYSKLQLAVRDLAFAATSGSMAPDGLVQGYIDTPYRWHLAFALVATAIWFAFMMYVIWNRKALTFGQPPKAEGSRTRAR